MEEIAASDEAHPGAAGYDALARIHPRQRLAELGRRRGGVFAVIARGLAIAVLMFAGAGVAGSILARWPYQFTGPGSTGQVAEESLFMGTLLGPPVVLLVFFGVAVFLAPREGRIGFVATVALIPMLVTMVGGSLGEALSPQSPDVPHLVQLWGGIFGAAVYLGLLVVVVRGLHGRQ